MSLKEKIESKKAKIAIVGLGYVGLPLAIEFVRGGFEVHGIDVDSEKVSGLNGGRSHVLDVPDEAVRSAVEAGKLFAHDNYDPIRQADCVSICVPTPLKKTRDPDISFITGAVEQIVPRLHPDMLVVLESTTYPGTTDELVRAEIEKAGFEVGKDIFVCFSPERVDPGNRMFQTRNTPKDVSYTHLTLPTNREV